MKRPGILSFHNLTWPDGIEFVYSPFAVAAFLQGQKFAQMEFSEDGNMFLLDMYREDQMFRRNIYDDRGFLSVTAVYRDGQMAYEQYLNVSGVWKICRYADGHVEVNPKENHYLLQYGGREETRVYQRLVYENLESLIREVFAAYVAHISPEDIFCIAAHPLHSALLGEVLKDRRKIISFFNERCRLQENKAARNLAMDSDAVVVNSRDVIRQAGLDEVRQEKYTTVITPFDSRMDFGRSLQLKEQHILVAVDGLSDPGVSQFYVCLEDGVVSDFLGEEKEEKLLKKKHMSQHRLKRIINGARKFNEDNGFSSREQAVDYDKVMKYQRDVFYDSRNRLLDGGSLEYALLRKIARSNVKHFIKTTRKMDRAKVHRYILDNLTYMLETENPLLECLKRKHLRKREVKRALIRYTVELIDERIESFEDEGRLKEFIRLCALHTMDDAWVEEVDYVQQLQYVISGRQSAQRNPVYEYQQEAYSAFLRMQIDVKRDLLRNFLLGEPQLDAEGNMKILFP